MLHRQFKFTQKIKISWRNFVQFRVDNVFDYCVYDEISLSTFSYKHGIKLVNSNIVPISRVLGHSEFFKIVGETLLYRKICFKYCVKFCLCPSLLINVTFKQSVVPFTLKVLSVMKREVIANIFQRCKSSAWVIV